ncbi:hypothetical protein BEP19_13360 [Ammoniphilus oxalaticus]|uniref:Uncharacterized protein n=1 Tax=Ammoniphilus oxalaticus TaxID=66863 RepID=A0A419SF31_9BACL|nr:hypothetical protein [Ammoniphilus oxalaticus]RKD22059.1 hypothetical protein BEP19_13360 [Ammoniphilus oxalaticus]
MKKWTLALVATGLLAVAGGAWAATSPATTPPSGTDFGYRSPTGPGSYGWTFDEMRPHMKQMHPNLETEELEQMYQHYHIKGSHPRGHGMMMQHWRNQ